MNTNLKEKLAEVDILKKRLDSLRPLPPEQEQRAFAKLRLEWNYHSNAIEGNQYTLGETRLLLMDGITAQGKPIKDYLDIEGHNHVIDWLLNFVRTKSQITEAEIRELHKILLVRPYEVTAATPDGGKTKKWVKLGEYKTEPNQVVTPTGQIHQFALPQETPAKMGDLMKWLRTETEKKELHPIVIAAIFHHEFVSIHPFDDGNGRMARILMNLLLMQDKYPPAIIKIQERDAYFLALARADNNEREPFIGFIADKLGRSLGIYLKAATGESIEDYDDIDKKIALLKQELDHVPEPKRFSPETYRELVNTTVANLLAVALKKLSPFDSLYLTNVLYITNAAQRQEFPKDLPKILNELLGKGSPSSLIIQFHWTEFKKGDLDHFNDGVEMTFLFFPLKYRILWTKTRGQGSLENPYEPELSQEQCQTVVNDLAEHCYETIQWHRRKGKS
jgi:Fic family protein